MMKNLFLLCGAPGSGKSTWLATQQFVNACCISRDAIRFSLVSEDEPYFSREHEVFDTYIASIQEALNSTKYDIIYCDATQLNENARNKVLDRLDLSNVKQIYAVVLRPSLAETLRRNAKRIGRQRVPDSVVQRMYNSYTDPVNDRKYSITPIYVEMSNEPALEVQKKIWVTSDLHINHDREFIFKPRGFENIQDMNNAIVERWNEVVGPDDDVYVLGDLMLGDSTTGIEYLKKLNGTLHIVLGNHDSDTRINLYHRLPNVAEVELAIKLKYKKHHFFMTHYPCLTSNFDNDKPLVQRLISLCGHTHTSDAFFDWIQHPIFHCELDTNNCYPWLLDDILTKIYNNSKDKI